MQGKIVISAGLLICSLLFGWGNVLADGMVMIEVPPSVSTAALSSRQPTFVSNVALPYSHNPTKIEALSVKYHRVKVVIDKNISTTYVDQEFLNDYDIDVEGMYIFPLPEAATLKGFSVYVDNKKITGEVVDKEQARRNYEELVRKGGEPALLEYAGKDMFRVKIYPIPKHSGKRIELVYQEVLKYDSGLYTYEYPLDTERFSPKPIDEVAISVEINSSGTIKNVYSPSHEIGVKLEKTSALCSYEEKNARPDKNFFLHYSVSDKDLGLNVLCYRKPDQEGYFMLLLSPGQIENRTLDKDVIFVLDTSGSMWGEKMEQAKEALKFCLNRLRPKDRFNVITFNSKVSLFKNNLMGATKGNVKSALEFVDGLKVKGGTNINDALVSALKMHTHPDRPKMIIFLTDGEASAGEDDPKKILQNLPGVNTLKSRIFVFGIGEDVDTQFLNAVSQAHRGSAEYVLPNENIGIKVASFYQKVSEPVLSDISLDFGDIKVKEIYPIEFPDIFKGTQLVLLGKYDNQGKAKITLEGKMNNKNKKVVFEADFPQESAENDSIPRIWATRKIGYLLSEMRLNGETKKLRDEVIALSKEYGVITPHTSFLLDTRQPGAVYTGTSSLGVSSVLQSGNISISQANGMEYNNMVNDYRPLSLGTQGVAFAASERILQDSASITSPSSDIKYVAEKTFYRQQNGDWVDSAYKEGDETQEIKYLSRDYFDLIKKNPWITKYLGIGKNIILVHGGKRYYIKE